MSVNSVPDGLNVSINKLTQLLQLSLNNSSPENTKVISGAIVELIAHTTHLLMVATTAFNSFTVRENNLSTCLHEMKALVKIQQKKLQLVRPQQSTSDNSTQTDPSQCGTCAATMATAVVLRKDVNDLNQTIDTLRRKLVQSKCLIQGQQIIIDGYDTLVEPNYSGKKENNFEFSGHRVEPWRDLFGDKPISEPSTPLHNLQRRVSSKQPGLRYTANIENEDALEDSTSEKCHIGRSSESQHTLHADVGNDDRTYSWNEELQDSYSQMLLTHERFSAEAFDGFAEVGVESTKQEDEEDEEDEEGDEEDEEDDEVETQTEYDFAYDETEAFETEQVHTLTDPLALEHYVATSNSLCDSTEDSLQYFGANELNVSVTDGDGTLEQKCLNGLTSDRWADFHDGNVEDSFALIQTFYETGFS